MKKILTLTVCCAFVVPLMADARPEDKEHKRQRKAFEKAQKAEEKAQRRFERGQRPAADFQPQVNTAVQQQLQPQPQPVMQPQPVVQPQVTTEVNTQAQIGDWRTRRGPRSHSWTIDEAQRHWHRGERDRDWWRSRYTRFARFGGGYYYWDRGYWYPAYGYDSRYNTYRFDEPIYGYNQIEPERMLRNVQVRLRRMGYYRGAIDGLIGPMTRSALARFQRDHGLRVTRRVDGPTMAALGVV
jgi:hypothetical protein